MPKSDWARTRNTVVLGLIVWAVWTYAIWGISSQQSHRARYTEYATGQSGEDARKEIRDRCSVIVEAREAIACTEMVLDGERDNRRSDNDLQAQQGMEQWARWMVYATGIQVLLGGIGLFLIVGTFRQTAQQVDLSRRAYVADHRPWLKLTADPCVSWVISGTPEGEEIDLTVTIPIENVGRSPAIEVTAEIKVEATGLPFETGVETAAFARECMSRKHWAWSNLVIFPEGKEDELIGHTREIPDAPKFAVVYVCVLYRAAGREDVFHTAVALRLQGEHLRWDPDGDSLAIPSRLWKGSNSIG